MYNPQLETFIRVADAGCFRWSCGWGASSAFLTRRRRSARNHTVDTKTIIVDLSMTCDTLGRKKDILRSLPAVRAHR